IARAVHPLRLLPDIQDSAKVAAWSCPSLSGLFLLMTETPLPVTAGSRFFCSDGVEQGAELVLDSFRRRHGLGDFLPDQPTVTPPQTVDGHLERLGSHAQLTGEFVIGPGPCVERERAFQTFKEPLLAGGGHLFAESGQTLVEKRQGPTPFIQGLGRGFVARL